VKGYPRGMAVAQGLLVVLGLITGYSGEVAFGVTTIMLALVSWSATELRMENDDLRASIARERLRREAREWGAS
jgi:flagellar biosynthesis component FlhA